MSVPGASGEYLRKAGYAGEIVSFEPVAASAAKATERASTDPRWTVMRLALGSTNGPAAINVSRASDLSSFRATSAYAKELFQDDAMLDGVEMVELHRLDALLDENRELAAAKRIFLKLDTRGWDMEVVAGAEGCLDRILGIQVETSVKPIYDGMPSYLETLASLEDRGFELTAAGPA